MESLTHKRVRHNEHRYCHSLSHRHTLDVHQTTSVCVCVCVSTGLTEHTDRGRTRVGLTNQDRTNQECVCVCVTMCVCVQVYTNETLRQRAQQYGVCLVEQPFFSERNVANKFGT